MMDSARQVVRWSIPGSVFVFVLVALQSVENLLVYGSITTVIHRSALADISSGAAALLVLAGVPFGFLLNQFYYALYWNWMPFYVAGRDRGGEALRGISAPALAMIRRHHESIDLDTRE